MQEVPTAEDNKGGNVRDDVQEKEHEAKDKANHRRIRKDSEESALLVIFDDKKSIIHLFLGIAVRLSTHTHNVLAALVALIVTLSFIVYQIIERELPCKKLGDFIEFIMGYILCSILLEVL